MTELTPQSSRRDFLSQPLLTQFVLDWEKTIYLIFFIVAIVSRFWGLGDRVMSHDESLHTQFSYQYYDGNGYSHTPLMHGPFLFHATALSYWLFGDGDFAARVPVAILGILLVFSPILFRQWIGRIGALFASFFFLISPYTVYYSRYIRHDIYVIIWAMMIVAAIWHYPLRRENKWLWMFSAGTALMFATKEVSFIYVAIFGSYLILRLLPQVFTAPWFGKVWPDLRLPIIITLAGLGLMGGGFVGHELASRETETAVSAETQPADEGFAADPTADATAEVAAASSNLDQIMRWVGIVGIGVLSFGLFMVGNNMRPFIDGHPEFDFIVLFILLVLPSISPLFSTIIGVNPLDYTVNPCPVPGQETMNAAQVFFAQLTTGSCYASFFSSPVILPALFLILTLAISITVGLWWDARRFLIAGAIFYTIFILFFTSLFTNPGGFASGAIGSLGYWLEQQEVQRGSQPWFYYFFVMPFYEFLPLLFSLLGIRLWFKQQRLNLIAGYFFFMGVLALFAFSFVNWLYNRSLPDSGIIESSTLPGALVGALIVAIGLLIWLFVRRRQIRARYGVEGGLWSLLNRESLCEFMPFAIWWLFVTTVAYSYAGEKMPWLSVHFVIPMAFIGGWYFNEKLKGIDWQRINWQRGSLLLGLSALLILIFFLALSPILLGEIEFGNQLQTNLSGIGRFLGGLLLLGGVLYLWNEAYARTERPLRRPAVILSIFLLLSLLTIRFTYMANFLNDDLTTEYMVYAHGAPATKEVVLTQLEELSMRMHGDKSIRVSFDNDVSWPYTWYLRDYPNRNYFGESPSAALRESPIIIVGRRNWDVVEPYLGDEYSSQTYTFLWWPMEEYRHIGWNALLGTPASEGAPRLGLLNGDVRHALWDIFFYRDYEQYGQVFGGSYSLGEWPLRHELRLYIRNDVQAELWDYGVGSLAVGGGIGDPYAENELTLVPEFAINGAGFVGGGPDELNGPRNVAVGPTNGRIYVTDANSQQVKVYEEDGAFVTQFGEPGSGSGQFAAVPDGMWGIAVDEQFVYVADTWNHRIQKFTLNGEFVLTFGNSGAPDLAAGQDGGGLFFGPRDIALMSDNRLLVTDTGNHRLQMFDRDGNFIAQTGSFGVLLGQLNEPVSVAVSPLDGSIFVTDTWNQRIQQFSPDLFPLREWEIDGWDGQSINNKPYLAVDDMGRIYTSDPEGYRILIFDANGTYLGRFGRFGEDSGSFSLPNGIALDAENNLVIADALNNRVVRYPAIFGPPAIEDTLPLDGELEIPAEEEVLPDADEAPNEEDEVDEEGN